MDYPYTMAKKFLLQQHVLTPCLEGCLWQCTPRASTVVFFQACKNLHGILSQASNALSDLLVSLQSQQNFPNCHCFRSWFFLLKIHNGFKGHFNFISARFGLLMVPPLHTTSHKHQPDIVRQTTRQIARIIKINLII